MPGDIRFAFLIEKQTGTAFELEIHVRFSTGNHGTIDHVLPKNVVSTIQEHSRHFKKKLIQVEQVPDKGNNRTPLRFTDSTNPVPEPLVVQCNDLEYECNAFCIKAVV